MQPISEYLAENALNLKNELIEFLKIPSISCQEEYVPECQRAAEWLERCLMKIGFSVTLYPVSSRHPMVYAESPKIEDAPTLLIYGHYDVQPVDPLDLWTEASPFEPEEKNGCLYGRGTSDDKGPLYSHIAAAA